MRTRRTIDVVILSVVVTCLAIAVVRVALATADVPFVLYAAHRDAAAAKSAGRAPATSIPGRFASSWPFASWWGRRRPPYLGGGDYLKVISNAGTVRTLGVAVGVIDLQLRKDGAPIDRMISPFDRTRLYGRLPGALLRRANGTTYRDLWTTPAQDASLFSDIPQVTKKYDPVITVAQAHAMAARTKLTERTDEVFVAAPVPRGSGTWILLAQKSKPRRFYVVPIELSPVGRGL